MLGRRLVLPPHNLVVRRHWKRMLGSWQMTTFVACKTNTRFYLVRCSHCS
jgi:hypothetical protein